MSGLSLRLPPLLLIMALGACGASKPAPKAPKPEAMPPSEFLLLYAGTWTHSFENPGDPEEVLARLQGTSGDERKKVLRDLAVAHLHAAEGTDDKKAQRKHRRESDRYARLASRGRVEDYRRAEMRFVQLWNAWRAGEKKAEKLAETITEEHRDALDVYNLSWAIRGEIALDQGHHKEAASHYRYLLTLIEHPLFTFALYRTAAIQEDEGRKEDAEQALREAVNMGCKEDASKPALEASLAAAAKLGLGAKLDPKGTARPASCGAATQDGP
ncbi:MAG: hypothetical protein KC416_12405 [Myxococcales bacterium]|nr:hypothetical protein [Myxococcales bacterium]